MNIDKKTIIIISAVVAVLLVVVGIFWFVFRGESEVMGEEQGILERYFPFVENIIGGGDLSSGEEAKEEQVVIERKLVQLHDKIVSSFVATEGGVRFIDRATGHVYDITSGGADKVRVSNTTIPNIFDASWSYDGSKAIINYFEENVIKSASVVFADEEAQGILMPQASYGFSFAPNKDRIFYLASVDESIIGVAADPDNSNQNSIFSSFFGDFNTDWTHADFVSLLTYPSGLSRGSLYKYDLNSARFVKIFENILGLDALWAPDGKKVLLSSFDEDKEIPRLFIYGEGVQESKYLGFQTLVQKCAWSNVDENVVYCAVPRVLQRGLYPDDWLQGTLATRDDIWKLNIQDNHADLVFAREQFDIDKMDVAADDSYLYFTEKDNGTLWSLKLGE